MNDHWVVTLEQDPENGDLILPFPQDFLDSVGWQEGDTLLWKVDEITGAVTLEKK